MKTYRGYFEEGRARITGRSNKSPWNLAHHKKHSDADLLWKTEDENIGKDLARSILLDAFGIMTCNDIECFCESKWVESVYEKFYTEVISDLKTKEEWRIKQVEVCDFAFDTLREARVASFV